VRPRATRTATSRILASLGLVASLVLSLLGASALLLAPQASAFSPFVQLAPPPNGVALIPPAGLDLTYGYAVNAPAVAWHMDVRLVRPGGINQQLAPLTWPVPNAATGTGTIHLAPGRRLAGVYTLIASLTYTTNTGSVNQSTDEIAQFTLAPPASRTALSASPRRTHFGGEVHFVSTCAVRTLTGFRRLRGALVELQGLNKHRWVALDTATANARGRARWNFTWNTHRRSLKVRAVTHGRSQSNSQSVSRPVTIHSH
jgi:hypothetical protein